MKFSEAVPSKYLKATDIGQRQVRLIILRIAMEEVEPGKTKPILYFTKSKRGLVLNKTNGLLLAAAYGDEMDRWAGKEVVLYSMKVPMQGKIVDALRVEIPMPAKVVAPVVAPVVIDDDEMPDDTLDGLPDGPDDDIPF